MVLTGLMVYRLSVWQTSRQSLQRIGIDSGKVRSFPEQIPEKLGLFRNLGLKIGECFGRMEL